MLLAQHGGRRQRRLRWLPRSLRDKGWQAFLGLAVLVLVLRMQDWRQQKTSLRSFDMLQNKTEALQRLLREHDSLIDELAAGIEAVRHATRPQPGNSFLGVNGNALCRALPPPAELQQLRQRNRHKMAVIVPYRDRPKMLETFLPAVSTFLKGQGREFGIFVMEQSSRLRFNRGLLLNAGALVLAGSDYDYFVFHDVDTIPTEAGSLPYDYPAGKAPLHLTPPGIHPKVRYQDFFGGVTAFTKEQLQAVNGYGNRFWGWGREDDNMRERLKLADMWPPDRPSVPKRGSRYYFRHSVHSKAPEVRVRQSANGSEEFFETNPDRPFGETLIVSSQPGQLDDFESGLHDAQFWIKDIQPLQGLAIKYSLEFSCDKAVTPWCEST